MKIVIMLTSENQKEDLYQFLVTKKIKVFSEIRINGYRPIYHSTDSSSTMESGVNLHALYSTMHLAILPESESDRLLNDLETMNEKRRFLTPIHAYQISIERALD